MCAAVLAALAVVTSPPDKQDDALVWGAAPSGKLERCDVVLVLGSEPGGNLATAALLYSVAEHQPTSRAPACVFHFSEATHLLAHREMLRCLKAVLTEKGLVDRLAVAQRIIDESEWVPDVRSRGHIRWMRSELLSAYNWFRFYLQQAHIDGHARALYLDSDVIIRAPLRDLYATSLTDGQIGAAVPYAETVGDFLSRSAKAQARKRFGLDPMTPAINAGVLLIDCVAWNRTGLLQQWAELKKEHDRSQIWLLASQPELQLLRPHGFKMLDWRWNHGRLGTSSLRGASSDATAADRAQLAANASEAHILHWNGGFKPWVPFHRDTVLRADLWEPYGKAVWKCGRIVEPHKPSHAKFPVHVVFIVPTDVSEPDAGLGRALAAQGGKRSGRDAKCEATKKAWRKLVRNIKFWASPSTLVKIHVVRDETRQPLCEIPGSSHINASEAALRQRSPTAARWLDFTLGAPKLESAERSRPIITAAGAPGDDPARTSGGARAAVVSAVARLVLGDIFPKVEAEMVIAVASPLVYVMSDLGELLEHAAGSFAAAPEAAIACAARQNAMTARRAMGVRRGVEGGVASPSHLHVGQICVHNFKRQRGKNYAATLLRVLPRWPSLRGGLADSGGRHFRLGDDPYEHALRLLPPTTLHTFPCEWNLQLGALVAMLKAHPLPSGVRYSNGRQVAETSAPAVADWGSRLPLGDCVTPPKLMTGLPLLERFCPERNTFCLQQNHQLLSRTLAEASDATCESTAPGNVSAMCSTVAKMGSFLVIRNLK